MALAYLTLVGFGLILTFVLYRVYLNIQWNRKYKLPPRVPGIPILGNTFQMPVAAQGRWAQEQAKKYGELFTCQLGGNTWIFLNSSRLVSKILDKRAAITSSRPDFPMVQGVMSADARIVLMNYGDKWRELRKIMHGILNAKNTNIFKPYQDVESKQLVFDYLQQPEKWYAANQRFANSVIMSVVFGRRAALDDPDLMDLLDQSQEFIRMLQPGASLVDGFPILAKLPQWMHWWRPAGLRALEASKKCYGRELDRVQAKMATGSAPDCFAVEFLRATEKSHFSHTQKLFVMGSLMEAGSDTSRITTTQICAAAAIYPEWAKKAREALDRVCGGYGSASMRLPGFEDRYELDYITAAVKEGLRWRPFAQIGMPHMLSEDDEFEGWRVPKGTVFTYNAYAIALDENEYEDPEVFKPERFLNEDLHNVLKGHWAFGPGRRVCVGYNVAETNVWIAISRLLYCFDFEQVPGSPIDSHGDWAVHDKAPCLLIVKPRSEKHARLIRQECSNLGIN